jgi:hypothetical protein
LLLELQEWYRNFVTRKGVNIKTLSFFETKPLVGDILVVEKGDADPGVPHSSGHIPVGKDHFSICTPDSKDSTQYKAIIRFIKRDCFQIVDAPTASINGEQGESLSADAVPSRLLSWPSEGSHDTPDVGSGRDYRSLRLAVIILVSTAAVATGVYFSRVRNKHEVQNAGFNRAFTVTSNKTYTNYNSKLIMIPDSVISDGLLPKNDYSLPLPLAVGANHYLWFGGHCTLFSLKFQGNKILGIEVSVRGNSVWTHYSSMDGVLRGDVMQLAFGGESTLWVATENGLARFRDNNWKVFNFESSITQVGPVWSLVVGVDGIPWCGTDKGLIRPRGGTWEVFNAQNSVLPSNRVLSLAAGVDGALWAGTDNGLARFVAGRWEIFNSQNSPLPDNAVRSLAVEGNGTVWAGTDNGLARFVAGRWEIFNSQNSKMPFNIVQKLAAGADGSIYVSTGSSRAEMLDGLVEFRRTEK